MIHKRYFALKDALGFPIPGTVRGYDKDPCKCELVELLVQPPLVEGSEDYRRYHPEGLHYYYQIDRSCCNVVPNSLIITRQRPKGRYVEFMSYNEFYFAVRTASFTRNNCGVGFVGSSVTYSKTYLGTTDQATVDAEAAADATFTTEGQTYANVNGVCTPE